MSRKVELIIAILTLLITACACVAAWLVWPPLEKMYSSLMGATPFASNTQPVITFSPSETLSIPTIANSPTPTLAFTLAPPDPENLFNPQGTPLSEWNGIPILPQATAGQEFEGGNYSFKANISVDAAQSFYEYKLFELGWAQLFHTPSDGQSALMTFQKDNLVLSITITYKDRLIVVTLSFN